MLLCRIKISFSVKSPNIKWLRRATSKCVDKTQDIIWTIIQSRILADDTPITRVFRTILKARGRCSPGCLKRKSPRGNLLRNQFSITMWWWSRPTMSFGHECEICLGREGLNSFMEKQTAKTNLENKIKKLTMDSACIGMSQTYQRSFCLGNRHEIIEIWNAVNCSSNSEQSTTMYRTLLQTDVIRANDGRKVPLPPPFTFHVQNSGVTSANEF